MPESWGFSPQSPGGGGEISPGSGSTGFSSRALLFANSSGQITDAGAGLQWDSTQAFLGLGTTSPTRKLTVVGGLFVAAVGAQITLNVTTVSSTSNGNLFNVAGTTAGNVNIFTIESTGATSKIGFWGAAPATRAPAYTTAAITTARVFPTTAGISTFTGVSGAGASFTSRADLEALVRVVDSMYQDLKALGLLQ